MVFGKLGVVRLRRIHLGPPPASLEIQLLPQVPGHCFVTNRKGDSPTVTNNYTSGFQNNGLRVFNGGQLDFTVEGLAAIQSSAAPALTIERPMPVKDVVLRVDDNKAPTGADLLVDIVVGGSKVITGVMIAAGQTAGGTAAFAELGFVAADTPVSIDITQMFSAAASSSPLRTSSMRIAPSTGERPWMEAIATTSGWQMLSGVWRKAQFKGTH